MRNVTRILAVVAALVLPAAASVHAQHAQHAQHPQTKTVVLVRHAEKVDDSRDPALSADGLRRADALAAALADAGVDAIFTTQFQRTRDTAAPLARLLDIEPVVIQAAGGDHAAQVAARVLESGGTTILVVGHSNTVPAIVSALGAPAVAEIEDDEYFHMFIVRVTPSGSTVIRTKY